MAHNERIIQGLLNVRTRCHHYYCYGSGGGCFCGQSVAAVAFIAFFFCCTFSSSGGRALTMHKARFLLAATTAARRGTPRCRPPLRDSARSQQSLRSAASNRKDQPRRRAHCRERYVLRAPTTTALPLALMRGALLVEEKSRR